MIFWRSIKNYRKLKEDESVDIALKQIKEKEYVQKFKNENNEVLAVVYFILNLCAKFSLKSQPSIYGKYGKWIL